MTRHRRRLLLQLLLIAIASACGSVTAGSGDGDPAALAFDADLAEALGADDHGMRRYVMALLKAGPTRSQNAEEAGAIQRAHMANIRRLAEDGSLIIAGPFLDGGDLRGVFLFAVDTVEEARALTQSDPAVQSGRLVMELHPWYGPAALMHITDIQHRITRRPP